MKKYFTVVFLISTSTLFSQEKPAEEHYQECLYNSLSDKGIALKRYVKGFEKHLIKLEILKDSSSQSYYNVFKSISEGKAYAGTYKYSFIDSINKIEKNKIIPFNIICYDEMLKLKNFKESKLFKIQLGIGSEKNNKFSRIMKVMISVLEEKDFKLDFYKQRTFIYLYFSNLFLGEDALSFAKEE